MTEAVARSAGSHSRCGDGAGWRSAALPTTTPAPPSPVGAGFRHEATLRKRFRYPAGGPYDELLFTLFADELAGSPSAAVECRAFDVVGERLL